MSNEIVDMSDKDLINEMIKEDLTAAFAREKGLSVSKSEITEYVANLRGHLESHRERSRNFSALWGNPIRQSNSNRRKWKS